MGTETLAVLVPVLNRPQNVAPLVESFRANCPPNSTLVVLPNGSDEATLMRWALQHVYFTDEHAVKVVASPDALSWPEKINYGIQWMDADWYLCAADDVRFTEGWWDATARLRADSRVGVVGTNDSAKGTGNPRVASGDHTVHPLVRGVYARSPNLDGGPFCVESVRHWYSDDLIVAVAKKRNAWAYCADAVIEHLHPYWGHGEMDGTYQLGESSADQDREAATEWAAKWLT